MKSSRLKMGKYIKISFGGSDFIAYGKLDAKMNHTYITTLTGLRK